MNLNSADPFFPTTPGADESRGTILVVDDMPAHLALLVDALHTAGYRPLVASSGEKALQRLATVVPDLVLLDMRMPGLGGLATLERLRAATAGRNLPVIFMTAVDDPAQKVAAFSGGAVDYVVKPFQRDELIARIELHLRLVRTERQLAEEVARRAETERALEASLEQAVLVVGADRAVEFVTPRARGLLARYFGENAGSGLPQALLELLRDWRGRQQKFEREFGTLAVRVFADPAATESAMLLLEEHRIAGDYSPLRRLGLSDREAEVLFWMSEGKSNPEIALIIGAAAGTVKKHAENIFQKLGVESRATATRRALDCLAEG